MVIFQLKKQNRIKNDKPVYRIIFNRMPSLGYLYSFIIKILNNIFLAKLKMGLRSSNWLYIEDESASNRDHAEF